MGWEPSSAQLKNRLWRFWASPGRLAACILYASAATIRAACRSFPRVTSSLLHQTGQHPCDNHASLEVIPDPEGNYVLLIYAKCHSQVYSRVAILHGFFRCYDGSHGVPPASCLRTSPAFYRCVRRVDIPYVLLFPWGEFSMSTSQSSLGHLAVAQSALTHPFPPHSCTARSSP